LPYRKPSFDTFGKTNLGSEITELDVSTGCGAEVLFDLFDVGL
jgi:hypothetical protein